MTEPREVELKLEISGNFGPLTESLARLGKPEASKTLTSVYFDTPEQVLRKAGVSLRVRHNGESWIQTVKDKNTAGAGLFDRPEWENEIDGDTPMLVDSPLRKIFGKKALLRIEPIFRSVIERSTTVVTPDDALLELVLDQGEVVTEDEASPVCEVEIELKHGGPAALFALARQLGEIAEIRLGVLTKSERGYRLLDKTSAKPTRAEPIVLVNMTAATAFQTIAWSCLRQFRLNEMLLSETGDADALHQARVGLRRLRSALSVFKDVVADERLAYLRAELRWLAATLGEARNIDVLIDHVSDNSILERLQAARAEAYQRVQTALSSSRSRSLTIDLAEWLTVGAWLNDRALADKREAPIAAFAGRQLQRFRKRLKQAGAGLAELDDESRHAARIEAKKLRYATEFFTSLFTGKKLARRHKLFREALETLQTQLGDLNDQATAPAVLRELGIETIDSPSQRAADRATLLLAAAVSHQRLMQAERFW